MASGGQDWKIAATAELVGHGASHASGGVDTFSVQGLPGSPTGLQDHEDLTPASGTKPHNIANVDETSPSTIKNKTISNALAKSWEDHKNDVTQHAQAGMIIIWSGTLASIPSGWALCDGNGGRPNLLDKFVKGVPNGSTNPGDTGGATSHDHGAATGSHTLITSEIPEHTHGIDAGVGSGSSTSRVSAWNDTSGQRTMFTQGEGSDGGHTHTIPGGNSNPEYYEIAFIIKS